MNFAHRFAGSRAHLPPASLLGALVCATLLAPAASWAQNVVRVPPAAPPAAQGEVAPVAPAASPEEEPPAEARAEEGALPAEGEGPPEAEAPEELEAGAASIDEGPAKSEADAGESAQLVAVPPAPVDAEEEEIDPETLPFTGHQLHLGVSVGARVSWVSSDGVDPFSSKNAFAGPVVRFAFAPLASGRFSVALLPEWSFVQSGSTARGIDTSVAAHRLSLGVEGRYHLLSLLHVYLRVAPGAVGTQASFGTGASQLTSDDWGFHVDGVVGAAVRLAGSADGRERSPRLLLYVEGGYDWNPAFDLRLSAGPDGPPRSEPLELGSFDWSAPHVGGGLAVTF